MSRIKPAATTVVIKSTEEADTVLARIAAHKRRIELIDLSAAEEIDEVKARAAAEAEPIKQEIAGLEQSLLRYADYARDELFRGRKSLQLTFGTIGYRLSTKLKTLPKWTSSACWNPSRQEIKRNIFASRKKWIKKDCAEPPRNF